jgi:uncharacterized membrane protein YqjE
MATDLRNGTDTEPSVTGLVKGIIDDVQTLTKQQFALLKQEIKEDMANTQRAATPMLIGIGILAISSLLLGITLGLLLNWAFPALPLWGAFAIVTVIMVGVGFALFTAGQKKFQTFNPLPDRTLEALTENVQALTGSAPSRP